MLCPIIQLINQVTYIAIDQILENLRSAWWVHLKQLEFLSLSQIHNLADNTKTLCKYFYTFPCNSKHFYCIGTINEPKKTQFARN